MSSPSPEVLLDRLDPEQRQVATALRGPVRVLAGAGTGKTRAITHRIAYGVATGVYVPTRVLAVTFTTRAAGEMRGRLRDLGAHGVQARTFHSAALRQARYFWPRVYGGELPQLMDSKLPLVGAAARRNRLPTDAATLRDLAGEIEWAKVSNVRPDDYPQVATDRRREVTGLDHAQVARVMGSYEEVKRDQGRMDMEDVLLCAAAVLTEDERVAAEVRRQYQHFVVDEFQDVSPVQWALLKLWLGDRDDLCVVGDPAQTIYSFAGASARYLLDFGREFPRATSVDLVRNYRSTPQIIEVANTVVGAGAATAVRLRSQQPAGAAVTYREHTDEVAEAEAVAAEVRALLDAGTPAREVALLFRVNAQSEAYEEALAARNIPYVVRGAERFFRRAEVRQAVTLLRGGARSAPDGGGRGSELVDQTQAVVAGMGWSTEAPGTRGNARDRWESLQAIVDLATAFSTAQPEATLGDFVDDLDRRAAEQHAPVADGVTVATLHTAKGLEWDAVFLCGVHEGMLPISYARDSAEAIEEERRLFYVGVTRARAHLAISWALARAPGGKASRKPSRFLDGLRPESAADRPARAQRSRSRPGRSSTCRVCHQPLLSVPERKIGRHEGCPSSYDEALFERLRAWRSETAQAESVPAYVVFTDLTLQAIAETRPGTVAELLRINGIGRTKQEKYGEAVLEVLATSAE